MAEDAARELPNLPLEDALQLVHLYFEQGSPKAEPAARRWLVRYLSEGTPSLRDVAKVTASLAESELEAGLERRAAVATRLQSYFASHQFSEFVSGFKDWAKFLTVSRTAVASGIWFSGSTGTSLAICVSALFMTRACWRASRIRSA